MAEKPNYSPRAIVYDPSTNATRFTSLGMAAGFGLQNIQVRQKAPSVKSGGNAIGDFLKRIWAGGPLDKNPDRPIYDVLNFLGLQILTDFMTGNQAGQKPTDPDYGRFKGTPAYRIQGAYARYSNYERQMKGYKNVADNDMLIMSPSGKLLSEIQAESITFSFHAAEKELYDLLAVAYDLKDPQYVLDTYDMLAAFYHNYGHLARETDSGRAAEMRAQTQEDMSNILLGGWIADISSVFSPDEVMAILREARSEYIKLNRLEEKLSPYQESQTLPVQAAEQNLTNDMAVPIALIEQTNAVLLKKPDLPNNMVDVAKMPGFQSLFFDVDEEAIRNNTTAVTNVYVEVRGRPPVHLVQAVNTGLARDVRVTAGQDVLQAFLEAMSPTQ